MTVQPPGTPPSSASSPAPNDSAGAPPSLSAEERREFLRFASDLADAAGAAIAPYFRNLGGFADKSAGANFDIDPVTEADTAAERAMRALIEDRYPGHSIAGEEFADKAASARYCWTLDPIDGTRAFLCGLPVWTTLISLDIAGQPAIGVIDQSFTGERWLGDGHEAYFVHRGQRRAMSVRACAQLADAVISTTDPRRESYFTPAEADAFAQVASVAKLARFGCDAYAYAMLAMGHIDLVIESGLKSFDVHALVPVITGAGGLISDWRGGSPAGGGQVIAAGDRRARDAAMSMLLPAAA